MPRIIALAGSARKASWNKQLVRIAAAAAERAGATVTVIDLVDYPLPIFNEDLEREQGTPEHAARLVDLFTQQDGILLACPEYNSSITPLLKNTIDWMSRPTGTHPPLAAFHGKVAALMSTSPGGLGGMRGLVHVRSILGNIGVMVLPQQFAIGNAGQAFNADGQLVDEKQQQNIQSLGARLLEVTAKLGG